MGSWVQHVILTAVGQLQKLVREELLVGRQGNVALGELKVIQVL